MDLLSSHLCLVVKSELDQHRFNSCSFCQMTLQLVAWKFTLAIKRLQGRVRQHQIVRKVINHVPFMGLKVLYQNLSDLQLTRERPRWHFVDIGQMTDVFLDSAVLRDDVHPNTDFMMTVLEMYLNLHADHGKPLPPPQYPTQDFEEWDAQDFTEKILKWQEDYRRQRPKYCPPLLPSLQDLIQILRALIF